MDWFKKIMEHVKKYGYQYKKNNETKIIANQIWKTKNFKKKKEYLSQPKQVCQIYKSCHEIIISQ